jgi:hypothetical protein
MTTSKTTPTAVSVDDFLTGVKHPLRQADARHLVTVLQEVTGEPPVMWGPSIVGFGNRHYRYESGREGDTPAVSFSPRASQLVLYIHEATGKHAALLEHLGTYTTGKSCIYVKSLADIDESALRDLVRASLAD